MWLAGPARRRPAAGRPGGLRPGFAAHAGHAHVAQTALKRLRLDRVIWLVTPQNPLKPATGAPLAARLASARVQAQGPGMIVSDVETRIGARYTIDTLRALKARHPGVKFVWIMGGDSLASFHRWRGWTEILQTAPVVVVARPQWLARSRSAPMARRFAAYRLPSRMAPCLADAQPPAWIYLRAPLNFASSTALREAQSKGTLVQTG
jgi:nicotinate-nucleotide adenylyltransferase